MWRLLLGCVLAALVTLLAPSGPAQAGTGPEMPTVAGGFGEGPAAELSMGIGALTVYADRLYASDLAYRAIRSIDLRAADHTATLVAGEIQFDGRAVFYPDNPNFVGLCPTGVPATSVNPGNAHRDLSFDSAGNLYTLACGITKIDPSGTVTAIAVGNGFATAETTGEDVPARKAFLWGIWGVAPDRHGNLYYAEANGGDHCRIRRITPGADGVLNGSTDELVRTVVGGDTCGFSGDGGRAREAQLRTEDGDMVFDPAGNLYFSDPGNHRIRKVTPGPDGVIDGGEGEFITTLAGSGNADPVFGCITGSYGGDGGPADQAHLSCPLGIAFDSRAENLYIADYGNTRVRKVHLGTTCVDPTCTVTIENQITTVAGNGKDGPTGAGDGGPAILAPIASPDDVAVDGDGNFYIDSGRKVDTSGIITTFMGTNLAQEGWVATRSQLWSQFLNDPIGVAVTPGGEETYVSDLGSCRVRRVDTSGRITTVAGSWPSGGSACASSGDGGPASQAQVDPRDVAADGAGSFYIAERTSCRVRKVSSGTITTVAGTGTCGFSGDDGSAASANLNQPFGIHAVSGTLYIADTGNCRIRRVSSSGTITTVAGIGTCGSAGDGGRATSAQLNRPNDVFADGSGNLYIADTGNCRIRKVSSSGTITTVAGDGTCGRLDQVFEGPATATALPTDRTYSVAADPSGSFYIGVIGAVYRVDASGNLTWVAGARGGSFWGEGAAPKDTALGVVHHLDVDSAGSVYVASTTNYQSRVRRLSLPDFTLTASPSTQSLARGKSTSYTVSITPSAGFSGSVQLSVTGLPSVTTASFSPNPAMSSSKLTVTAGKRATPGTYPLTITGTSGSLSHTTSVTLIIKKR